MLLAVELFFTGLLILATVVIAWISVVVVLNLYRGQR